jgi:hypothetical protein
MQKLRYQGANLSYVSFCKLQALTYSYLPASVERTIQYKDWSVEGRLVFRSSFYRYTIKYFQKIIFNANFKFTFWPWTIIYNNNKKPSHTVIHRIK